MQIGAHRHGLAIALVALAITATNPSLNAQCQTPVIPGAQGWGQKTTYYIIRFPPNDRRIPSGAISGINDAFKEWNTRLLAAGLTSMKFQLAVTDAQKQDAVDRGIVIENGQLNRSRNEAARANTARIGGFTVNATITFDFYNSAVYQAQRSTFENYVRKVMRHEIGHTFTLDDHPEATRTNPCGFTNGVRNQPERATIMNDGCGLHDSQNNMPNAITDCDMSHIPITQVVPNCPGCGSGGSGPGSGGPIGGGGDTPCRPFIPDIYSCEAICRGQLSYYHGDTCGNYWGDWCGYLFPDIWPEGDIVCETSGRLVLREDLSLAIVYDNPTGRYKDDGNGGCYWDPNDSGPNQCQPYTGRWKDDGNGGCYWDEYDSGPDQCQPTLAAGVTPRRSASWRDWALVASGLITLGGLIRRRR